MRLSIQKMAVVAFGVLILVFGFQNCSGLSSDELSSLSLAQDSSSSGSSADQQVGDDSQVNDKSQFLSFASLSSSGSIIHAESLDKSGGFQVFILPVNQYIDLNPGPTYQQRLASLDQLTANSALYSRSPGSDAGLQFEIANLKIMGPYALENGYQSLRLYEPVSQSGIYKERYVELLAQMKVDENGSLLSVDVRYKNPARTKMCDDNGIDCNPYPLVFQVYRYGVTQSRVNIFEQLFPVRAL